MPDTEPEKTWTEGKDNGPEISVQAVPSTLSAGGKETAFTRAVLTIENTGQTVAAGVVLHATFAQERGIVHDASEALSKAGIADTIEPGKAVKLDVYDLLLAAHPGVASKVHLWGFKAVLDWWLDFTVWAEYRTPDEAASRETRRYEWRLRWSPAKDQAERIALDLEAVKS